jgi:hypothetical protein
MPRPQIPFTTVRIAKFASDELSEFVAELYTRGDGFKVDREGDVVSALILAARQSPPEITRALVLSYWERERQEAERLGLLEPPG